MHRLRRVAAEAASQAGVELPVNGVELPERLVGNLWARFEREKGVVIGGFCHFRYLIFFFAESRMFSKGVRKEVEI